MATSSIFANVKITAPKKAEAFVNALETSANEPKKSPLHPLFLQLQIWWPFVN